MKQWTRILLDARDLIANDLMMRLFGQILTSARGRIILLFAAMVMGGCDREVIVIDDTPAQFVEANNDGRSWEVYFDKPPKDLSVDGAEAYTLSGTTLLITGESCRIDIIVLWQGGKRTFDYACPKYTYTSPNQRTAETVPPAKIRSIDPPPGATIPSNQQFELTFDKGVTAAKINGTGATGSGANWTASPALHQGPDQNLNVEWTNRDGSSGSQSVGPYTVRDE